MTQDPGQPSTTQSPEGAPVMPAPESAPSTPPGVVPGCPAGYGYGYAPPPARHSRKPIFLGLGAIGLVIAIAVVGGALLVFRPGEPSRVYTGTFSKTGSMGAIRFWHAATLLFDGRVLIAGGDVGSQPINSAELHS